MSVRVLVVGGSGFTGKQTIPALLKAGMHPVALARSEQSAGVLKSLGAEIVTGDLDNASSLQSAFKAADANVLLNIASLGFGHASCILAATKNAQIKRAVFVSTTGIFTKLNPASKAVRIAAEDAIRASDLDWTLLRPTMIYGLPGDRNMERLLRFLKRFPVFPLPNGGKRLQQPLHVTDLADALTAAVASERAIGRAYNLSGADALPFRTIIKTAAEAVNKPILMVSVPLLPLKWVVSLFEKLSRSPRLKVEQLDRLEEDKAFEHTAAKEDLGFNPRTYREGITAEARLLFPE